ncbi:vesicle-associated membrane protein 722 [Galendromus occidentalis]|uniref:Vesicle-associated membrane protein 7 n=1 Tax=Galendromus occidentalis TaxID=34638 RepID=A0AAJ6QMD9_9ACAR|nr:vesicle-associated membrane protein 722 [Galendromus occidentalis]
MSQLQYGAVCRGYTVLVSHQDPRLTENAERYLTDFLCTFSTEVDTKTSFSAGGFKFHIQVQAGMVFCCGATPEAGVRLPFLFLAELSKRFTLTSLPSRAYNAEEHEFDREFQAILKDTLDSFNSGKSGDQVEQLKSQVNDVKGIMQENIKKALDRGARMDDLVDQTENLESQSVTFRAQSGRVRRKMWLQNLKMWIIIGVVVSVVVLLIILKIAGVF